MNRASRALRRGVALALLASLLPASMAAAGVLEDRLADTRREAKEAKQELTVNEQRQQRLARSISGLNDRIVELERPLHELEREVEGLEYRIEQREQRIVELRRQREAQRKEIIRLQTELQAAQDLLSARVVAAYMAGETGMVEQLAASGDLQELFSRDEALSQVVGLDERVIARIASAERNIRIKRARNVQLRAEIREDIEQLDAERAQVDGQRAEAQRRRDEVASAKAERDSKLQALREREQDVVSQLDNLEEDAKVIKDIIENGTSTYSGTISGISASGLIWPVSGPIVSPFGPRWGRMHEGIDIAIGAGNPIAAAAPGVVTHAGWMGGYGNMVIIQHAGNLSTGYAHQSAIHVSAGQTVGQGQVIGLIGCTGHCYGDHLHFETYISGSPVDPMQFL